MQEIMKRGKTMGLEFDLNGFESANRNKMNPENLYDTIIIGGGPAGLNAALYAKRKGLDAGMIADHIGGQVVDTSSVENYLGLPALSGRDLMQRFEEHAKEYAFPIASGTLVKSVEKDGAFSKVHTDDGKIYRAKSVIVATGSKPRTLGVAGEKEYLGKGVAYCAICDGPLFGGLDVIVAGGGNSAVEAALDLAKIASKVTLVHRSRFRADKILLDRLAELDNVEIHLETQIKEIRGEKLLTHILALDKTKNEEIRIDANGLFVEIGYLPRSEAFDGLLAMNERNEISVNKKCETSAAGIFAAGDVTDGPYKQIVVSASEGAIAALSANDYVNKIQTK